MAYCFALDETPQAGLRRIAREQANRAISCLELDRDPATTIHETRKCLKRLRALLQLVRRALPRRTFQREVKVVRDVARSLSGARDFEVMPVTLAALGDDPSVSEAAGAIAKAIDRARKKQVAAADRGDLLRMAASDLDAAAARYAKLRLADNSFATIEQGVADGLRLLRRQHLVAVEGGDDGEVYHDWRKSVQQHWRHLRLVSAAWPALIEPRIGATKNLATVLGLDNDLAVLAAFIEAMPASRLRAARRKAVYAVIGERQALLRAEARALAGLLVDDRPKQFAARLRAYWNARQAFGRIEQPLTSPFAVGSE